MSGLLTNGKRLTDTVNDMQKTGGTMKVKLDNGAIMPTRAHKADAGLDLYMPKEYDPLSQKTHSITAWVEPRGCMTVDTGVHVEIPEGYVGMVKSKSGLNINHGIVSEGVIDSGYTGSIRVKLYNNSKNGCMFCSGQKISQLVLLPIITPDLELVEALEDTERGASGFGSTGDF
jgi:dUTP pyrophosphatase